MTHKTTISTIFALAMTGAVIGAGPAQAFCIDNKSHHTLRVHLETYNPFGKYVVLFKPGKKGCCGWFNPRCNPTRERNGILTFSVRTKQKAKNKLYCASGWIKRVYATADGDIKITENKGSLGGLRCDSRDSLKRPVTQYTFTKRKKRGMPPPIVVPPPPER